MKNNDIKRICMRAKRIRLYSDARSAYQWISDGYAIYPLIKLPKMDQDNILSLFDIGEKQQAGIMFEAELELPQGICFHDADEREAPIRRWDIALTQHGRILRPFETSVGMIYINDLYLKPFDKGSEVQYYERFDESGNIYVAVKEGFFLSAIISPYDVINWELIKQLRRMYELTNVRYDNNQR